MLRLLRVVALLLIYNEIMGGVIRWSCASIGLAWLMYAPMMFAFGALVFCCAVLPLRRNVWVALVIFVAYVLYSMLLAQNRPGMGTGRAAASVGFAVYTWIPLFVGLLLGAHREERVVQKHAAICWGLAVIGVLVNRFVPFPWMGATVEVAGQEISVGKNWSAGGVLRLAGFARASYVAADEIAILSTLLVVRSAIHLRWRALVGVASIVGIALTTSKGPLMVPFVALCAVLAIRAGAMTQIAALPRWIAMSTVWLLMMVMVGLPLILRPEQVGDSSLVRMPEGLQFISISSLGERAGQMWPEAFDLIKNDNNLTEWILGRGLGGIGTSQSLFEPAKANAGDNLFVFAYVTLGIGCVFIGMAMLAGLGHYYRSDPEAFFLFFALAMSVLTIGIVANVIEGTVPALSLGILVGKGLGFPFERRSHA